MRKFTHLIRTTAFCFSTFKRPEAMEPLMLKDQNKIDTLKNNLSPIVYEADLSG